MRIVHVVRQFYPAVGGLETMVRELASRQVAAGHRVKVVSLDRLFKSGLQLSKSEFLGQIAITRIPYVGSSRYPFAFSVLKHLGDADIVHVHGIDFFFDFLAWTKPIHGKKLVVSTHGGFFHTSFASGLKRLYFSTVTRASLVWYDGVVAVSSADEAKFCTIRKRGLVCLENGVNVSKFSEASSRVPIKSMLWIGRFSQNKRLDRLISFFAALLKVDPQWKLTIAGQPWDFGINGLRDSARTAHIDQELVIKEAPSDVEIKDLMGANSVIVSTSDYEGFGIAAIEGMCAGLFPLLSEIAPYKKLVARAGVGLTVNFDRKDEAVARFLETWSQASEDYGSVRAKSISAAAQYGWEHIAEGYQSLYGSVLGKDRRNILGVPVCVSTQDEAVKKIDALYDSDKTTIIAFANANLLNVAAVNPEFRAVLKKCLVMNDGIGVDAASRILFGSRFPQNLNGTDFTPNYLKNTRNSYRIFFLGSSSGVAERAASKLMEICDARHQIAGCQNGYARSGDTAAIVAKIRASRADVVLVAMGNPAQEMWLAENLEATGCRLGFGVGALFDFLSGDTPRAPTWVRSARMEWVYRLVREPGRLWRRYLVGNPIFLVRVLNQWLSGARV